MFLVISRKLLVANGGESNFAARNVEGRGNWFVAVSSVRNEWKVRIEAAKSIYSELPRTRTCCSRK